MYFRELIEPTIAELDAYPTSIRHAYAACMFAWHFVDAVVEHDGPYPNPGCRSVALEATRKAIATHAKPDWAYWMVAGIATLAKHLKVTRLRVKPKLEDTHIGPEAAFDDGRYWEDGRSWADAEEVVRTWDEQGNPVDVRLCLRQCSRAIEAYLAARPELR